MTPRPDEVLIEEAKSHAHRELLARLCHEVLSFQAESRNLSFGKRTLRRNKSYRGLARADAETSFGNLLSLLERGPEHAGEWALLAIFFVLGFEQRFHDASALERRECVERFLRQADFLELATPYAPYRFMMALLSESTVAALLEAIEASLLAPLDGPSAPAFRARAMLRIQVLALFDRAEANAVIVRAAEQASDATARAAARDALGEAPVREADGLEVRGTVGAVPRLTLGRALAHLSGLTTLIALARGGGYILGFENEGRVRLERDAVHVHREIRLLGKTLRVRDASYALRDIECAARVVSLPTVPLLLGAAALSIGVMIGVVRLSDGIARADTTLVLGAFVIFAIGAILDLSFWAWAKLRGPRAGFEMTVDRKRVVALSRVDSHHAQRMVEQISQRRGA